MSKIIIFPIIMAMMIFLSVSPSAFADNIPSENSKEQTVFLVSQQDSDFGIKIDNSTGVMIVDLGTVFTIAGTGIIPDYIIFDHDPNTAISREWISPISLHGDWSYFRDQFIATNYSHEGIHNISLMTDGKITYSLTYLVLQLSEDSVIEDIPLLPQIEMMNKNSPIDDLLDAAESGFTTSDRNDEQKQSPKGNILTIDLSLSSPLKQFQNQVLIHKIQCRDNLILMESISGKPICVTENTAVILENRGYATIIHKKDNTGNYEDIE